ncbi:hypothetical protein FCL40_08465 [Ferrimonas sediminicola]|uniref:Uncharacterized protein n=1 Tax=Ferrimonas sediminicola TaxID=2569538 RepID=A0A4U1BER8_9GAMM|nr:hypothetical protein [Ferrimonas sediminicola]TKB49358.1 hypothetical protein FCL40_08465 [Ferrimonas sediminicola]
MHQRRGKALEAATLLLSLIPLTVNAEIQWVQAPTLVTQDPNFSQLPLTLHSQWGNSPWYTETSLGLTRQESTLLTRQVHEGLGARVGTGYRVGRFSLSLDLQFQHQQQQSLTVLGFNTEVKF